MRRARLNWASLILIVSWLAPVAWASDPHDIYLRTGTVTGIYNGSDVSNGNFTTNINAEAELWLYSNPRQAWIFRMILENESDLDRTRFFGAGTGQRYFIYSEGMVSEGQFGGDVVRIRPHWAVYAGWDLGLGQFLIAPFGPVLSAYATTVDLGGVVGVRKSITKTISADAMLGYTYSSSVLSTTSATANSVRFLLGVGLTF